MLLHLLPARLPLRTLLLAAILLENLTDLRSPLFPSRALLLAAVLLPHLLTTGFALGAHLLAAVLLFAQRLTLLDSLLGLLSAGVHLVRPLLTACFLLLTRLLHHLLALLSKIRTLLLLPLGAFHSLAAASAAAAPLPLRGAGLALLSTAAAAFLTLDGRAATVAFSVAAAVASSSAASLTLRKRIGAGTGQNCQHSESCQIEFS